MKRKLTATTLIATLLLGVVVFNRIQTPTEPVVEIPQFVPHGATLRDLFP